MTEAAPLPTSAASAGNTAYGENQEILILFGLWCRAVQYTAPADWPEDQKQKAYAASGDDQERLQRSIARMAMRSEIGKSALLWIITLGLGGSKVDPKNFTLPHPSESEHRGFVLEIAHRHPELARLASVSFKYFPEDGSPPIVFTPIK